MTEDLVAAGRVAWGRLQQRKEWADWLAVGRAVAVGRNEALKAAQTNRAVGSRYNRAMGAWLAANGLADVCAQERYRLLLVLENLPAIQSWRDSLPPEKVRALNHPNAVWWAWKRATKPATGVRHIAEARRQPDAKAANGRAVFWSQDAIRRAADAMREARSNDLFVLARLALQAAVRNDDDLAALEPRRPKRRAASSAPVDIHA